MSPLSNQHKMIPCVGGCGTLVRQSRKGSGRCRPCADKTRMASRTEAARHRMLVAIEQPTLDEAMEAYGTNNNTFWRSVRKSGLEPTVREKYAEDLAEKERVRLERARAAAYKGQAVSNANSKARAIEREAALVEDADFLARTGEHPVNAARRLGFKSVRTLEKGLYNAGRADIMARLWSNDGLHEFHNAA